MHDDPRVMQAKAIRIADVVERLGIARLRLSGGEMIGPCPICGGRDRFGINLRTNAFLCRKCDLRGRDQIALVTGVLNLPFKEALQWLCGDKPPSLDSAEIERRRRKAEAAARKQKADAEWYRRRAISSALAIWSRARPGSRGVVQAYLTARGIPADLLPDVPDALRFVLNHRYVKKIGGEVIDAHCGPCMIAGVLDADGHLTAVHQTWVSPEPPHGKAHITWNGATLPSKLVRGSKKAGAIRLFTPRDADTLVMGEGIETTLSAMAAVPIEGAAYWAGVDLGNMSGRMVRQRGVKHSGVPDMSDINAFVPPPWVKRLVFLMDGDSAPGMTRAKLLCGLRRAMAAHSGLKGEIVKAPSGFDFNDVLNGDATIEADSEDADGGDP